MKNCTHLIFCLLCLLLATGKKASAQVNVQDSLALVTLYDSTNGSGWANSNNWLTGPVSSWSGITVTGKRVTVIYLDGNNLSGVLPQAIGSISNLQYLYLADNNLTGSIPDSICNLTDLAALWLTTNKLTGHIPEKIGKLKNMEDLRLDNNMLNGTIPLSIGNLTKLQNLILNINHISGTLPDTLQNLVNLQDLAIGTDSLTGTIPSWIGKLVNVQTLDLSVNQLTGSIPTQLGGMTSLQTIYLDNNQLTGSIPASVGSLTNLQYVDFSSNQLSGPIPVGFGNCSQLQTLMLNSNQLTDSIPSQLGNLSNLVNLYIDNNQLSGSLPSQLGNLSSLQTMSIWSNNLNGPIPASFGNLSSLLVLEAEFNQLQDSIPTQLGNLLKLQDMELDYNNLTGQIPAQLGNLSSLTHLDLSNNSLTDTIPSQLGKLSKLNFLGLNSNKLTGVIPKTLGNLSKLNVLNLSVNTLTGPIPSQLGNLTKLNSLDLSYNQLTDSTPSSLVNLTNLQQLRLNNNNLTGMPNLSHITNLSQLAVQNNYLLFKDLVPNAAITGFNYSPQAYIGKKIDTLLQIGATITYTLPTDTTTNVYHWYKDTTLTSVTTGSYAITNAAASSAGSYYSVVTNPGLSGFKLTSYAMRIAINVQTQSASMVNIGSYADVVLGQPCFTVNSWGGASDSTFSTPGKIAIDPTTGKVFVADNSNHRVLRWSSANAMQNGSKAEAVLLQNDFSSSITGVSANTIQFSVGDITIDYLGNLYVVDIANSRVLRFNNASSKATGANADAVFGQVNLTTGTSAYTIAGDGPSYFSDSTFYNPVSVTTDKYGNLYVADFGTEVIMRFDSAYLKSSGAKADGVIGSMDFKNPYGGGRATDSTLNAIGGLSIDKYGNLYVADFNANRVVRFDNVATAPNGIKASAVFGQFNFTDSYADSSAFGLNRPNDVCADTSGNIYIMDSGNNRVVWIDSAYSKGVGAQENGVIGQSAFGETAYGLGQNILGKGASHVSFDPIAGKLWVSDNSNNRILRFGTVNNPVVSDSLALVALYNSTNGSHWKNNTNWLTGPVSTWYGVEGCGSMVTGLNLNNNNLSDSIPGQFTTIGALQTLKLDSNNITYIPNLTGITTLTNLQIEANAITFESIEPNISIKTIDYTPEDSALTKLNNTVAQGDSIKFSSLIGGTHNSYQWYKNNQPISGATSSSFTLSAVQLSDSGVYTCQVTNSIVTGLIISRKTITLSVTPLVICAATANAGANQSICQGITVTLKGTVTGATSSGWSTTGTGTFNPDTTSLTTTYTPSATDLTLGSIIFVLTADSATCPPVTDTMQLTILSVPSPAFDYTTTCIGLPVTFADTSTIQSGSINKWNWKFGDGDTSSAQNPVHTYAGKLVNYVVSLSVTSSLGCTDSISQSITLQTPPTANAGANQSICRGNTVPLQGQATGATTIGWSTTGTGSFSPDTNTLAATYTPSAADTLADSVIFTLTAEGGACPSAADTMKATINTSPTAAFTYAGTCLGTSTTFADKSTISSGTINQWRWAFGDGGSSSIQNPSHTYTGAVTNFTVSLTVVSSQGCTDSIARSITLQNQPFANISSDETICAASIDTINLEGTVSTATGGVWSSTGSGYFVPDSTSLNTVYQLSPTDIGAGAITFTYTTTGNGACQAAKSVRTVTFDKSCLKYVLMIPSGISPNGDGKNDYFVIKGIEGYPQNTLYIYDQNGFQLFTESNYQNDWAGDNQNGQELMNGTYYYVFDAGDKKLRGFVEIRR